MSKMLSYFYPITKKVNSAISGTLEITWYNGKKHLNTQNANYSYGSLQRILKYGLKKIELHKVNSLLLLGMGGGSVIQTLRKDFNYAKRIIAIDIDPVIIELAKTEFDITEDDSLRIICEDALRYVAHTNEKFDLIIVDLFVDLNVPSEFLTLNFWRNVVNACTPKGTILFNASLETKRSHALNEVIKFLESKFYKTEVFEKVNQTNTVIIARGL